MDVKKITYIDPPSGWKYGFPKILPNDVKDLREWLQENGYPENMTDLAMKYSRFWTEESETFGEDKED